MEDTTKEYSDKQLSVEQFLRSSGLNEAKVPSTPPYNTQIDLGVVDGDNPSFKEFLLKVASLLEELETRGFKIRNYRTYYNW